MDKVLIILKLISLKFPGKIWDKNSHFIFTHQDRKIMKEYFKLAKKLGLVKTLRKIAILDHDFLSYNKEEVYHLYIGPKYIWDHDYKYLWKAHEDSKIWKIEIMCNEKINSMPTMLHSKLLGRYPIKKDEAETMYKR